MSTLTPSEASSASAKKPAAYLVIGESFCDATVQIGQAQYWAKIYNAQITPLYAELLHAAAA